MDPAWIDAARSYNSMDERGRHHYWSQLTPEQRTALTQALAEMSPAILNPKALPAAHPSPRRRGLSGTLAIGCTGMILGMILTVVLEAMAVTAGINFISELLGMGTSVGTPDSDSNTGNNSLDCLHPRNEAERNECAFLWRQEREENWRRSHPGEEPPF